MNKSTSWGKVAEWYNDLLEKEEGTYQKTLILPNLLRLLEIKKGETILDSACGQGFFARAFASAGARVIGVDISNELITIAKKHQEWIPDQVGNDKVGYRQTPTIIDYHVGSAENLNFIKSKTIDKITLILALQNIENVHGVLKECNRVLRDHGKLFIVLNHPAFRIPKSSSWGWDEKQKIQYRRIDNYLTESKAKIQMHPGDDPKKITWSFHRPLQFYFKMLNKSSTFSYNVANSRNSLQSDKKVLDKYGFCVSRLEEWNSNKISEPGPRKNAEDKARKEIPMFLFIESVMMNI